MTELDLIFMIKSLRQLLKTKLVGFGHIIKLGTIEDATKIDLEIQTQPQKPLPQKDVTGFCAVCVTPQPLRASHCFH